jgi:pimeloyl-ACP methyl ester carboxylesterase
VPGNPGQGTLPAILYSPQSDTIQGVFRNITPELLRLGSTAADSRFVTIPNATHFLFLDRPEHGRTAMLKEIDGFLSKIK